MGIKDMKYLKTIVFLCILTFTVSCGQQKKYVQYQLKEGETMGLIAQRLAMKTADLLRLNPDVGSNPGADTRIVIPNKKQNNSATSRGDASKVKEEFIEADAAEALLVSESEKNRAATIETLVKEFQIHEVLKGETIYSLSRYYKITEVALRALNPSVAAGLKLGQLLKIRRVTVKLDKDEKLYKDVIDADVFLRVAIMLPFRAQELDTLSGNAIFGKSKLANIVTDLYLGAEFAIDSLRKQGVAIALTVFDTERNGTKIQEILAKNDLNAQDIIIGPLYSEEVQIVSDAVDTPIILPVYSKKQEAFNSGIVIKTTPNKALFRAELLRYIEGNFVAGNIIIVGDNSLASRENSLKIRQVLALQDSIVGVHLITPEAGYIKKEKFMEVALPNAKNIVVMTTDDDVIVASTFNSLISLPKETEATVFTFDKASAINKIDNTRLAQVGFTFVTEEYGTLEVVKTTAFDKKYAAKNGALPSSYATRGFDITYDVLMRLASGESLKKTFKEGASYRVESKFDYTDKAADYKQNKGLFIVKYNPDLTLTRIK
jgi:LysM repeat protein